MDRKEYWNDKYVQYWNEVTEEAKLEGNISCVQKETEGDYKTPGEYTIIKLFDMLRYEENEKILDYGCGFGRFFNYFREKGVYYGIDISDAMIEECRRRFPKEKERFIIGEGENLPFEDDFFDKIICFGVFDACFQEKALEEMLRITKQGGVILVTGKGINYNEEDEQALIAEAAARKKGHPNYFTDVEKMCSQLSEYVDIIHERYYLKRGDFGKDIYLTERPEKYYEWALILRKRGIRRIRFERFSDEYSNTWRKIKW